MGGSTKEFGIARATLDFLGVVEIFRCNVIFLGAIHISRSPSGSKHEIK